MAFSDVLSARQARSRRLWSLLAGVAALLLILPALSIGSWFTHVLIMVMLYTGLAAAWNFLGGYTGQFSVGHSAFFGVAGYTMGILMARHVAGPIAGAAAGILMAVALALMVGVSTMRLRGIFFSLTTFALAEILRKLALFHDQVTGGPLGLSLVIPGTPKVAYYYLALTLMMSVLVATAFFERSRFGMYCMSVRENEDAAMSAGVITSVQKVKVAVLSALFTGAGGALYAAYVGVIEPDVVFSFNLSIKIIILAIIGGAGSLIGPLLGAVAVVIPEEIVRGLVGGVYSGISGMVYGLILIVTILLKPSGVREMFAFALPHKKD